MICKLSEFLFWFGHAIKKFIVHVGGCTPLMLNGS